MEANRKINIIGAGFSGMTAAYYFQKSGCQVTIFEKAKPGGLIQTQKFSEMDVETAANGFLWTEDLQKLCDDIGVTLETVQPTGRKRFIWRSKPKRIPLGLFTLARIFLLFLPRFLFFRRSVKPRTQETIASWTRRCLGSEALTWLVAPALQGIYAGDPEAMSASLILKPFFSTKKRGPRKGTVAPDKGMSEFFVVLKKQLEDRGVKFVHEEVSARKILELIGQATTVVATEPWIAKDLVEASDSVLAAKLQKLDILPAVKCNVAFKESHGKLKGFGILFPRQMGFRALGCLANTQIFANRGQHYNESWILGGALDRGLVDLPEQEVVDIVLKDRERLYSVNDIPSKVVVVRWPKAFTHYDINLESVLPLKSSNQNLFLAGNYLGALGLAKILERNKELVSEITGKGL